jgi:hypothetical protein
VCGLENIILVTHDGHEKERYGKFFLQN